MTARAFLPGIRFGSLTLLEILESNDSRSAQCKWQCDCGETFIRARKTVEARRPELLKCRRCYRSKTPRVLPRSVLDVYVPKKHCPVCSDLGAASRFPRLSCRCPVPREFGVEPANGYERREMTEGVRL